MTGEKRGELLAAILSPRERVALVWSLRRGGEVLKPRELARLTELLWCRGRGITGPDDAARERARMLDDERRAAAVLTPRTGRVDVMLAPRRKA